jgi:small subunit ribosomal protein S17
LRRNSQKRNNRAPRRSQKKCKANISRVRISRRDNRRINKGKKTNKREKRIFGKMANEKKTNEKENISCSDRNCPIHGSLKIRGKAFKGEIIKKFPRRLVVEFHRYIYVQKYERYIVKKTKIHARIPSCMQDKINVGDYVEVKECRPLSKLIHFVVTKKIKGKEIGEQK